MATVMTEPYLIAHIVRGLPAFDIAIRFDEVPPRYDEQGRVREFMSIFDDETPGPWWVIPTSGRRAFPYWFTSMSNVGEASWHPTTGRDSFYSNIDHPSKYPPSNWPDYYHTNTSSLSSPPISGEDLLKELNL